MLTQRYEDAFCYAAQLHARQVRKGTAIPYLAHLLSVSALVLEHGGDEDEAIAGLLHDAVEDQGGMAVAAVIVERFGERVEHIVLGCSDSTEAPEVAKAPWKTRKERYLAHLHTANASTLLVSAADKLHNARALHENFAMVGDALWNRFRASKADVLWYYRSLVEAFRAIDDARIRQLVMLLDEVVTALEAAVAAG